MMFYIISMLCLMFKLKKSWKLHEYATTWPIHTGDDKQDAGRKVPHSQWTFQSKTGFIYLFLLDSIKGWVWAIRGMFQLVRWMHTQV